MTLLVLDLGPRKVRYAGDLGATWFVSHRHEPSLLALDAQGHVRERFPCPPVDRVVDVEGTLVGLDWEHAWGRRWGHSRLGEREHATGFDARTGRKLWHMERGLAGLVAPRFALGRERALADSPHVFFDIATGEKLWSLAADEPAISHDAAQLYILDRSGRIRAIELATGREAWSVDPPGPRRVSGNLCRVLLPAWDGVWYAAHPAEEKALLIRLGRDDGKAVEEQTFPGWVVDLLSTPDGLLIVHELGASRFSGGRIEPLVDDLPDFTCRAGSDGVAFHSSRTKTFMVASGSERQAVWCKLSDDWGELRVSSGVAVLASETRILRWPFSHRPARNTGPVLAELVKPGLVAQVDTRPNQLLIRTSSRGETVEEWVDLAKDGLDAVAAHLDRKLEQAGAARRIFSLETDGDWHAYVIRPPAEIERLRGRGVKGIG